MAKSAVTVRLKAGPCKEAMKRYATRCVVVVRGSGGDRWDTGGGTQERFFELELRGERAQSDE